MDALTKNKNIEDFAREPGGWLCLAAILIGIAIPTVVLGRALISAALALPIAVAIVQSVQSRTITPQWKAGDHRLFLIAAIATAFVWLLSCIGSAEPVKSLATWSRTIALMALAYLLAGFLANSLRLIQLSLKALIATSAIVLCWTVFSLYIDEAPFELYRLFKGEKSVLLQALKPYFSVSVCVLPVVVWGGWRLRGIWGLLALAHLPLTLLLIYGKGAQPGLSAFFGLAASIILMGLVFGFRRLSSRAVWIIVGILLCGLLVVASYVLHHLPSAPVSADQLPTLAFPDWHRQVIWGFTADVVTTAPLLGVGPNTVNLVDGANLIIPGMNQEYIPAHPHNWPLEIAAETGILGLLCFTVALLIALKCLGGFALRGNRAAWPAIALFGAFWGSSLANFSIWSAWWIAVFSVLMSITMAELLMDLRASETDHHEPRRDG